MFSYCKHTLLFAYTSKEFNFQYNNIAATQHLIKLNQERSSLMNKLKLIAISMITMPCIILTSSASTKKVVFDELEQLKKTRLEDYRNLQESTVSCCGELLLCFGTDIRNKNEIQKATLLNQAQQIQMMQSQELDLILKQKEINRD